MGTLPKGILTPIFEKDKLKLTAESPQVPRWPIAQLGFEPRQSGLRGHVLGYTAPWSLRTGGEIATDYVISSEPGETLVHGSVGEGLGMPWAWLPLPLLLARPGPP